MAAQFHFREYINGNQTFQLDSHRPFICSVLPDWRDLMDKNRARNPPKENNPQKRMRQIYVLKKS
jgi:hypothetical protein